MVGMGTGLGIKHMHGWFCTMMSWYGRILCGAMRCVSIFDTPLLYFLN